MARLRKLGGDEVEGDEGFKNKDGMLVRHDRKGSQRGGWKKCESGGDESVGGTK